MSRFKNGWYEEATPFYEEGGEAIGKMLAMHPEKEDEIWELMSGTGLWKKWYLRVFRAIWRKRNPEEAQRITWQRQNKRKAARKRGKMG